MRDVILQSLDGLFVVEVGIGIIVICLCLLRIADELCAIKTLVSIILKLKP